MRSKDATGLERLRGENEDQTSNKAVIKFKVDAERGSESGKRLDRQADRERNRDLRWRKMRYAVLSGS